MIRYRFQKIFAANSARTVSRQAIDRKLICAKVLKESGPQQVIDFLRPLKVGLFSVQANTFDAFLCAFCGRLEGSSDAQRVTVHFFGKKKITSRR